MTRTRAVFMVAVATLAACGLEPDALTPPSAPGHPLAYVSQGLAGNDDIFVLSASAATDENVTRFTAYDSWPSWSPDGTRIAFESNRHDPLHTEIYVIVVDSGFVTRLTADSGFADAQPAWSPLGDRIAFVSDRDSAGYDIYLMNTNGSGVVRLTADSAHSTQPAWSPDGAKIAFATDRDSPAGEIYVMDSTGANPQNLTNHPASDLTPAWSPDGSKIAFMSNRDSVAFGVFVMDNTGANVIRISPASPQCGVPSWTPDGLRIAFECDADIWVANADGTGVAQITRTANDQRGEALPRWKPVP
jgi:Tol biopolymer transport system component